MRSWKKSAFGEILNGIQALWHKGWLTSKKEETFLLVNLFKGGSSWKYATLIIIGGSKLQTFQISHGASSFIVIHQCICKIHFKCPTRPIVNIVFTRVWPIEGFCRLIGTIVHCWNFWKKCIPIVFRYVSVAGAAEKESAVIILSD